MSVEAVWDLRTQASPRSLCVLAAALAISDPSSKSANVDSSVSGGRTINPFEAASDTAIKHAGNSRDSIGNIHQQAPITAVFGTDTGSVHVRTYAIMHRRGRGVHSDSSSTTSISDRNLHQSHRQPLQLPFGVQDQPHSSSKLGSRSGTPQLHQQTLPRSYFPVDLMTPGSSVVSCILLSQQGSRAIFLLLLDDNRGTSANQPGAFAAHLACLYQGSFQILLHANTSKQQPPLPRMSCATFHPNAGLVYAAGRNVATLSPDVWEHLNELNQQQQQQHSTSFSGSSSNKRAQRHSSSATMKPSYTAAQRVLFPRATTVLPSPGARSGQDALALAAGGRVALVAVGSSFYAVAGQEVRPGTSLSSVALTSTDPIKQQGSVLSQVESTKIISFAQSSQVHPAIVIDVNDESLDSDWSCVFLANGRECATVDLHYGPPSAPRISCSKPRNGMATVASPILAAAESWPWVAVLTSDGLVSIRSPSCLAIPLRTVEVGNQPNDYFVLRTLRDESYPSSSRASTASAPAPWIVAISYSGFGKVLQCQPDTEQDLADRLMRLAIDAFGSNGFPRAELAEAVHASFTATSYVGVGSEASPHHQILLQQYLEAILGLSDWDSGGMSGWPTEHSNAEGHHGSFREDAQRGGVSGRGASPTVVSAATPSALLTGTALLCLVCTQVSPPNPSLANRSAHACAEKMGVVIQGRNQVSEAAVRVCEIVADKLLNETINAASFSLLSGSSLAPIARSTRNSNAADLVEAAVWLLRSCGKHERAIDIVYDRLQRHGQLDSAGSGNVGAARGVWSTIKYVSYTATHLSELWASGTEEGRRLVIASPATHRLLENNPRLGLSVFCSVHPQNEGQWRALLAKDDPLARPGVIKDVLKLLKSINPIVPYNQEQSQTDFSGDSLPLDSGRALAIAFLESAIGIDTGRPTEEDEFDSLPMDHTSEEILASFHDELAYLLLEGVISERRDDEKADQDSPLGTLYRLKLQRLLRWPLAKIRSEPFMSSLPNTFLQEKALVLGRLGRHDDALRILYRDLKRLDLALDYCDNRHERLKLHHERARLRQHQSNLFGEHDHYEPAKDEDNAYLPLVRVALDSDDPERGTAAAIQVLALRRSAIDRAAALRLLPSDIPVSAVARPFLIPALVDSESHVRRLKVVSALLRARYLRLKGQLTSAQLKAQANLYVVPQLRSLNLGDPLHSTNPFKARTNSQTTSNNMPDVMIVKHFFPRHLVIQAKVTNSVGLLSGKFSRTYTDVAFVVAESSEEAIQPLIQVPIQVLPPKMTGSAWSVLSAAPARMEGPTAQLTCELRYTIQSTEASSSGNTTTALFNNPAMATAGMGRTYVEELQDLEVHAAHFS